jgi:hypothetical protein
MSENIYMIIKTINIEKQKVQETMYDVTDRRQDNVYLFLQRETRKVERLMFVMFCIVLETERGTLPYIKTARIKLTMTLAE